MRPLHSSKDFVQASGSGGNTKNDKFISRHAERFQLDIDPDWTMRETRLRIYQMFLDCSIYDNLQPFHMEYQGGMGSYIPLSRRRPSTTYRLCEIIVNDTVGMLFGEGHFPTIKCKSDDQQTEDFLKYIIESCKLKRTMLNAAREGAIGSVCVMVKVLKCKFYFDVLNTKHLTPVFDDQCPDKLILLYDRKKIDGATLISHGYDISSDDKNKYFFLDREWNINEEIYYAPYLVDSASRVLDASGRNFETKYERKRDDARSTVHNLGFVPAVWIQNLSKAHHIDGLCTFEAIIDTQTEVDYQLSQTGRLLKYNSDPTFVVKNPSAIEGSQLIKSQTILNLDEKGDAYYAEMSGHSVSSVLDYVKLLREYALESVRGNRTSPEKLSSHQSGSALKMLNNPLVNLVDEMRLTYGDCGLLVILQMIIDIYNSGKFEIDCDGYAPNKNINHTELYLNWQDWYPMTGQDKLQEAQAITTYRTANIMSQDTAISYIAEEYGIDDIENEKSLIDKEKDEEQNRINEVAKVEPKPEKSSGS